MFKGQTEFFLDQNHIAFDDDNILLDYWILFEKFLIQLYEFTIFKQNIYFLKYK